VSLVAILDADKEGFLRSDVTLIQTMGRAARNVNGRVILYGDKMTDSMQRAVDETSRRRKKQISHNRKYKIQPETIKSRIHDRMASSTYHVSDKRVQEIAERIGKEALPDISLKIDELEKDMWKAADDLDFEAAAALRDQIVMLRKKLKSKGETLFK
jgi:excinuclease ABC subunit B